MKDLKLTQVTNKTMERNINSGKIRVVTLVTEEVDSNRCLSTIVDGKKTKGAPTLLLKKRSINGGVRRIQIEYDVPGFIITVKGRNY